MEVYACAWSECWCEWRCVHVLKVSVGVCVCWYVHVLGVGVAVWRSMDVLGVSGGVCGGVCMS